jgi:glycosyltransferase involved in cell wall biosynthesis
MELMLRDQIDGFDDTDVEVASPRRINRIALVGNYLPRLCGIATFTTDIHTAFARRYPGVAVDVYAMNDRGQRYDYPAPVVGSIDQDSPDSYADAARAIQRSGADMLWLQHEYGIFGGPAGDMILHLLDGVSIPVAVTLHTILSEPDPDQRRVMEGLVRRAARLIVMADKGRDILIEVYDADPARVAVIPHGIPDRPFVETGPMKERLGLGGRDVILTFGLLSPGKGIETMIAAMPEIAKACPESLYVVLGATHPHLVAHEGERYREQLIAQAAALGVSENVTFIDGFIENDELLDYLSAADVYVTPYLNPAQMTSGTLSYAVGLGKPVVSTPYVHAAELLADGHGRLVDFRDSAGFAREIVDLLGNSAARDALRQRTYALGRTMIWPRLAEAALAGFEAMTTPKPTFLKTRKATPPIPETLSFDAVRRLSDDTGIYQHSIFAVPDRDHGYCIDDNARALLLMHKLTDLSDEEYDRWVAVYAAFVQHGWNPDTARFRNFMSFDRRWLEDRGSDDSSARALWAIGATARDARRDSCRRWASHLFDQVVGHAFDLQSPRSQAFSMLAAAAMLDAHPGHAASLKLLETGGAELVALVDDVCRPDWAWFEIVLAYDNCRLPEALLRAGMALKRQDFIDCGLRTLDWIVEQQTAKSGVFRPVGSESFGRAYQSPLPFDQQPLEAWATIDACEAALAATGDERWRDEALKAYRWFQGENDLQTQIGDPVTGECFDGLMPDGVNQNHGAESVLAFHLATCAIKALADRPAMEQHNGIALSR